MKQIKITKPIELAQKLCREHGVSAIPFIVNSNGTVHINTKALNLKEEDAQQLRHVTFNLDDFNDTVQETICAKFEKEIPDAETEEYYEQLKLTPMLTRFSLTVDGLAEDIVIEFV